MASFFGKLFQTKSPQAQEPPKAAEPPRTSGSHPTAESRRLEELYTEATRAYEAKDFNRAIPLYEQVIALQPDHAEAYYKRGNALKDLGKLAEAVVSYDAAVKHKPDLQYAWCNRGAVQLSLGQQEAALGSFDRATQLNPRDLIAQANRAALLQGMSRWQEALAGHDQVLALNPQLFQSWLQRGNVLRQLGKRDAALGSYREALKLKPDYAEAHYNCGVLLESLLQPQAALAHYDQAIANSADFHQAHYNRAGLLKRTKQLAAALAAYDRTLSIKPDYPEAHANRGVVLQELERWDEALASYDRALALRPDCVEYHLNRSTIFKVRNQWDEALACCDRAIELHPDSADAHFGRSTLLGEVRRYDEMLAELDRAVTLEPDFAEAQYNRALALLLHGDYARGWPSYEWRWQNNAKLSLEQPSFRQPLWLGVASLAGKTLLVYSEQGLGDAMQFGRFIPAVARLGATVIIQCQAPLVSLLETLEGVSRVIADGDPLPPFDYHCPILSLPLALKSTFDTIPATVPYLRSDPTKVAAWQKQLGERRRPRIGLVWSGNPRQGNDRNRSFRLASWIEHLPRELDYVCLQKDIRPQDEPTLAANPWIARYELGTLTDTAALCECLDLVITVCTSVSHLSGALGKPTWVMLAYNADWRWLIDRSDSPWYPTVTLYRQQAIGDWNGVFTRIAIDLRSSYGASAAGRAQRHNTGLTLREEHG